jgi:tetratricopeptide (TPR) repeat protein
MGISKFFVNNRQNSLQLSIAIFFLSFLLYANTLGHHYTQDDAIVITENIFTQKGFSGIPDILKNDTFLGFFKTEDKLNLVSGGRYRPLSLIMFVVERELFGKTPFVGHLFNVLMFSLLCLLIFLCLKYIFTHNRIGLDHDKATLFALVVTLIYVVHPVHTEVVANIKGRDEILCMIGSIGALFSSWKYSIEGKTKYLVIAFISMFLGLMSKENAISFVAIIPFSLYILGGKTWRNIVKPTAVILLAAIGFVIIRGLIVKSSLGETPMELMNNPFLKWENNQYIPFLISEKIAAIAFVLLKYLQLLIFPHPLTHDYYPREIGVMQLSDIVVIFSILIIIGLMALAIIKRNEWKIYSFSIFYFVATLFLMTNILFPIGTHMNERFLFMPSLGFALLLGYLLVKLAMIKPKLTWSVFLILIFSFSLKSINRNMVWRNDYTLFTTDVKTSSNSAKILNAAGGALLTEGEKLSDVEERKQLANKAEEYLIKAIEIHPTYGSAYLLLGNAYFYQEKYEKAIATYEKCQEIQPNNEDVTRNLAVALRDAGRHAGEKEGNITKSENYLLRSIGINNSDSETLRLLGVVKGIQGNHTEAIKYFKILVDKYPNNKGAIENLMKAYINAGQPDKAKELQGKLD